MTMTRVYVPLNASGLRNLNADRALRGAPFLAFAVTVAVRASAPIASQDEWEYTALSDATRASAALLTAGESRRAVVAADVTEDLVGPAVPDSIDDSAVSISDPIELKWIASIHIDGENASEDDELLWYDVTELPVILALLT